MMLLSYASGYDNLRYSTPHSDPSGRGLICLHVSRRRETWEPNGCELMSEDVNNDSSKLSKIHQLGSGAKPKLAGAFVLLSCGATHAYRHL